MEKKYSKEYVDMIRLQIGLGGSAKHKHLYVSWQEWNSGQADLMFGQWLAFDAGEYDKPLGRKRIECFSNCVCYSEGEFEACKQQALSELLLKIDYAKNWPYEDKTE